MKLVTRTIQNGRWRNLSKLNLGMHPSVIETVQLPLNRVVLLTKTAIWMTIKDDLSQKHISKA